MAHNALVLLEGKLGGKKARHGLMACCNHAIGSEINKYHEVTRLTKNTRRHENRLHTLSSMFLIEDDI